MRTRSRPSTIEITTETAQSPFADDQLIDAEARGQDFEYQTCSNEFTFFRAQPSGLLVLNPRPSSTEMHAIYPAHYLPYRFDRLPKLIRRAREVVQKRKVKTLEGFFPGAGDLIDVGCGNGELLRLMSRFGPRHWRLHANDFNETSLRRLADDVSEIHVGPFENIEESQKFDVVILNQVFEHLPDVNRFLASAREKLRANGVLFIETPSFDGLDAQRFRHRYWGGYHFPRHFYIFNERLLARILDDHHFEVVDIAYLASPSFWVQSLHHALVDHGFKRLARFFDVWNIPLVGFFTLIDLLTIRLGYATSNIRVVARRKDSS